MSDNPSWATLVSGDKRVALLPSAVALLAKGAPVQLQRLATAAGWSAEKVAATLHNVPRVDWDGNGDLIGLALSLAPTPTGSTSTGTRYSHGARWTHLRCR